MSPKTKDTKFSISDLMIIELVFILKSNKENDPEMSKVYYEIANRAVRQQSVMGI